MLSLSLSSLPFSDENACLQLQELGRGWSHFLRHPSWHQWRLWTSLFRNVSKLVCRVYLSKKATGTRQGGIILFPLVTLAFHLSLAASLHRHSKSFSSSNLIIVYCWETKLMCPVLCILAFTARCWSTLFCLFPLPFGYTLKAAISLEALLTSFSLSQKKHKTRNSPLSYGRMAEPNTQRIVLKRLSKLTFSVISNYLVTVECGALDKLQRALF